MSTTQLAPSRTAVDLPRRAILNLPDAADVQIECRSGSLWITLDDDPRDFIVEAGERFITDQHRPALVYALQAAQVDLQPRRPAPPVHSARAAARAPAARWGRLASGGAFSA
jgi:hypothetical protein